MKSRKIIITSIIVIILAAIAGTVYYIFNKQDEKTSLTILEKQWIEENKNNIIDLSIVSNVPVFNYDGEGVFFDFINALESDTGLNFNKLSYDIGSNPSSAYAFKITNNIEKNQILMYEDNYVVITKDGKKYNNVNSIPNLVIGTLNDDLKDVQFYLKDNLKLSYKSFANYNALIQDFNSLQSTVTAIAIPKTLYLKEIVESKNYTISYNISEMKRYYVLNLGDNKKLNKIIKKYFKKWNKNHFDESFHTNFSNDYFAFKQVYEQEKVNFRSKRYSYGFINNAPYDALVNGSLVGINYEIIKDFAKLSDIEVSYDEYKNSEELQKAFNNNKIDFYLNTSSLTNNSVNTYDTIALYSEQAVVLSKIGNEMIINSLASLKGNNVLSIKDSKIEQQLIENGISVKTYNNVKTLLKKMNSNDILVIDKLTYETYMYDKLKDYKIDYIYEMKYPYSYTTNNTDANKLFNEYFNFYLSFINVRTYENSVNYKIFEKNVTNNNVIIIILVGIIVAVLITTIILIKKIKPETKKDNISKEDKLKYIDMLTSLKNRNYLNESMEKWDGSEIYPQAIVVVDLNNVAYINDNYGHEEGDNVIKEAASILIKTQLENTEIMRTNGNEFLIYMVQYEEKQVVSYIRKLNKEFKELNHGFGAALGYSMITDQLKTLDDAINEATLDMKNNKEEIQN